MPTKPTKNVASIVTLTIITLISSCLYIVWAKLFCSSATLTECIISADYDPQPLDTKLDVAYLQKITRVQKFLKQVQAISHYEFKLKLNTEPIAFVNNKIFVPPGDYLIHIEKQEYLPFEREIHIGEEQKTFIINAHLSNGHGHIKLYGDYKGMDERVPDTFTLPDDVPKGK